MLIEYWKSRERFALISKVTLFIAVISNHLTFKQNNLFVKMILKRLKIKGFILEIISN